MRLSVDDDEDFQEIRLPEVFTRTGLDTDEASAVQASEYLRVFDRGLTRVFCRLELIERALREAEPYSQRARQARVKIRLALGAFEHGVLRGMDEASLALSQTAPARALIPSVFGSTSSEFCAGTTRTGTRTRATPQHDTRRRSGTRRNRTRRSGVRDHSGRPAPAPGGRA